MGQSTFGALRAPLVDKTGMPSRDFLHWLQKVESKVDRALTLVGEIAAAARVQGRTEGIGTTVTNLTSAGLLADADKIAADGSSFVRVNPNQRTGGGRGFVALDANNRLAGAFRNNPVNVQGVYTAANPLSQDGTETNILVAASTQQFGDGTVDYNSGSVDPGSYGTFYVYADDPTFAGGAVIYQATANVHDLTAANGRLNFGAITTDVLGGGVGIGGGGGCPMSGAPAKFYGDPGWWTTEVRPCEWFIKIITNTGRVGKFSFGHLQYCRRGLIRGCELLVGDWALTEDGEEKLVSVIRENVVGGKVDAHKATQGHVYSAWGFICHNKYAPTV